MASRLLFRYARLLSRASSQASHASARLLPPVTGSAELQRAKGWPWVPDRLMCETKPKEDVPIAIPPRTKLDTLVENAATPEDVLSAWKQHPGNSNQAAIALVAWIQLTMKTKGKSDQHVPELMKDPRLQNMMNTLSKGVSWAWNNSLVSVLKSLWLINVPSTDLVLSAVLNELLWRSRRLTYRQLCYVADWGAHRKGQQDVVLVNAVVKQLELRWTEITDARTVSALMSKADRMTPVLMERLEDKALELAEGFTGEEIRKVCVSLATQRRRSVPLLRALSYHLLQKPSSEFTTPLMIDIAFAYASLNFHNTLVFQRMASELLPRLPELSPEDIVRFAKSLGFLKWLHMRLFEGFAEHYTANSQKYEPLQVCNLLRTFARLGFYPSKEEEFYSKAHLMLEESFSGLDPFLQTDVVWSLCVLQQAKPHYLVALLQPNHVSKLSMGSPSQAVSYKWKLLQIAATLRLEHPGSSDTSLSVPSVSAWSNSAKVSAMKNSLRDALQSFVGGKSEAVRTAVVTVYGWTIDGEMVVDCDNKPVDLSMLKAPHLMSRGGGDEALPAGARRLAFVAWEFANFGSKSKDLLGCFTMMKRHLQLAGFIVVEVPFYEWLDLKTDWQKSAYLKDKIGKAVAEEMAK
ncbi:protein TBRG4 isoform X2 [Stegastes partitus]|uniref:FAST kinase domain-containing protein 4 n=1 Tax=Stegastes partitus TaxID=144197 RepID=A0A9Y4MYB9_9TELE|nr:PREDICTED: protein TBRG4 isoform X2 [Stegastes partitus]